VNTKQFLILAGVGLVASGVITIALIYQPMADEIAGETTEFDLEEIHGVPLARHDHVSMSIFVNGRQAVIPKEVGMSPQLWHDHSLDQYGPSGISPMHTHDTSGTIHIESTAPREYTVGEFLKVMGMDSDTVTGMTINGNEVSDFLNHEMKNGERIQLEMTITP
jgi:hypothetical protein